MITAVGLFGLAAVFVVMAFAGGSLLMTSYFITAGSLAMGGLICIAIGFFIGSVGGDSKLLQTGMPGTATILSLQETGMVINYTYHVLNIGLRVQVGAGAPYDITVRQTVPMIMMARCTPGATVGVKVDPHDQSRLVIDWSMVPGINMAGPAMVANSVVAPPAAGPAPAAHQQLPQQWPTA